MQPNALRRLAGPKRRLIKARVVNLKLENVGPVIMTADVQRLAALAYPLQVDLVGDQPFRPNHGLNNS